jgi:glycosyltransferase involved in cell wall biosynthesis
VRDAVVYWHKWTGVSSLERIALALAGLGGKVLHCGTSRSLLRRPDTQLHQLEKNVFSFKPVILARRLNRFPRMWRMQAAAIVHQILRHTRGLGFRQPMFLHAGQGSFLRPVCQAMKARGFPLVYVCMDYWELGGQLDVELADLTLVIPRTMFDKLRARWGQKIHQIPQLVDLRPYRALRAAAAEDPPMLAGIPRPRLGYAGPACNRLKTTVLAELLERHREWSFISFQWGYGPSAATPAVPLPNAYLLPWQDQEGLARCVAAFDVGFMPYDCSSALQFNCVPLKLFDYFALGLPVVATPILHLREYTGLVYLGETAEELERAVKEALAEPRDSPKRQRRREVAEAHSVEVVGRILGDILG